MSPRHYEGSEESDGLLKAYHAFQPRAALLGIVTSRDVRAGTLAANI